MSRIYWDTIVFAYWIEETEPFATPVRALFDRMVERGDNLVTSIFTIGELLVGPLKSQDTQIYGEILERLTSPQVELISFDTAVAHKFASVRAQHRLTTADAIHLASAACARTDLFITNDRALRRLSIDGIDFIDGLETTALGAD